jgi:hypothetical protein
MNDSKGGEQLAATCAIPEKVSQAGHRRLKAFTSKKQNWPIS